jgi:hypothetical protein
VNVAARNGAKAAIAAASDSDRRDIVRMTWSIAERASATMPTMKRRGFVKALVAVPAVPALVAQQPPPAGVPANPAPGIPQNPTQPVEPPGRTTAELPKLEITVPDAAAEPVPRFFTPQQFTALQKLCGILMPATKTTPGALDAKAPEFLDFLLSESPAARQQTYRTGLDALNSEATKRFHKSFADLDNSQSAAILSSLSEAWTYDGPSDPLAAFLRTAKQDVRTATVNSREYNIAGGATSRRAFGGGLYWYPLD